MSYERWFHSQWGGVAACPVAGRRGEGGERGDVAIDSMVQQVTPGVPHTVGGVRTNLSIKDTVVLANTMDKGHKVINDLLVSVPQYYHYCLQYQILSRQNTWF